MLQHRRAAVSDNVSPEYCSDSLTNRPGLRTVRLLHLTRMRLLYEGFRGCMLLPRIPACPIFPLAPRTIAEVQLLM